MKRRQRVCGLEQACARETIAPKSIAVEEADLVPHKGRQHPHTRYKVRVGRLFRGADPQHADQGTFVDVGDPAASEAADRLAR